MQHYQSKRVARRPEVPAFRAVWLALALPACAADPGTNWPVPSMANVRIEFTVDAGPATAGTIQDAAPRSGMACVDPQFDCPTPPPCKVAACSGGECVTEPAAIGSFCDDKDACTSGDNCTAIGGCRGQPIACGDGNECTADVCQPATGCVHVNVTATCMAVGACALHACSGGACLVQAVSPCDDGNPCTNETCSPEIGCIYELLPPMPCDDGNLCTGGDHCQFGLCSGQGVSCDDGDPCTDDACTPDNGCNHAANTKPCKDGDFCTAFDHCSDGKCIGTAKACDDGDPCSIDTCNPLNGQCTFTAAVDGAPCPDGTGQAKVCSGGACK
jgi:hypothetical protein